MPREFTFTRGLKRRAVLEGWYIFQRGDGRDQVQRIDSQDHPRGRQLDTDDEAIGLAALAGVPVSPEGMVIYAD